MPIPKAARTARPKSKTTPKAAVFPTETHGLSKLGALTPYRFDSPDGSVLEAFSNRYPGRNYVITLEHREFTSLCPMTGQPDFGVIRLCYAPNEKCLESKSFKLYLSAFRNHGAFMESLTNQIAEDLIALLAPRRLTLDGIFNVRGGTAISVRVEYLAAGLSEKTEAELLRLW